jgi:hypothetical protein
MPELIAMELGKHIMPQVSISTPHFTNPFSSIINITAF